MYRITHTPTGETIAIATTWQDAAATLRHHAGTHGAEEVTARDGNTYNTVTADPSVVLHLDTIGSYAISRDEGDLRLCDTCGDDIGVVTSSSADGGVGSWSVACCADCAAQWEQDNPREPSDFRSHEIRQMVTASGAPTPAYVAPNVTAWNSHTGEVRLILPDTDTADLLRTICDVVADDTLPDRADDPMRHDAIILADAIVSAITNAQRL